MAQECPDLEWRAGLLACVAKGGKGKQDGVWCQRALRTILVPTVTSQGSPEMCCHFESPDTYFSFIHSDSLGPAASPLGPVHSDVVWDYWTNVAPSPQGKAPVPTPALCMVLAPGDLPFICLDHMMWFCLAGVMKRGLEKSAGPGLCRGVPGGTPGLTPGTRGVTLRSPLALCFGEFRP